MHGFKIYLSSFCYETCEFKLIEHVLVSIKGFFFFFFGGIVSIKLLVETLRHVMRFKLIQN